MNNITTYYAPRKSLFVWVAALLSLVSAVAFIAFACINDSIGGMGHVVHIILFVAANLVITFRLPLRGEKQFYVTVIPVIILTLCLMLAGTRISSSGMMMALCIVLSLLFAVLYFVTFSGKLKTKWVVFILGLGIAVALGMDKKLKDTILTQSGGKVLYVSVAAAILSILAVIFSAKKMPPYKEGDPYRLRFGDRLDGRRIRNMPVMSKVTPYFMINRLGRSNYAMDTIEVSNMERYVTQKRKEGYKHFGLTHVIVAAYVRTTAEMPELNRFVAGQRIYHRFDTSVNMVVKKEMSKDAPDSSIKVYFDPSDTAAQVYEKFDAAMQKAREEGVANGYDSITHVLDYVPSVLMSLFGLLLRFLDYFGIMPWALERVSPFHGSLFITSMGSLGIPAIYHHLYDLGTVPVFCAFGHKYTRYELNKNGERVTRKYMDYRIVTDEGICDGFYYAAALKKLRSYMSHPERLDVPPEVVNEDIF